MEMIFPPSPSASPRIPAFPPLQVAVAYWGKVQMMFVGAFIVDVGIEHVNLHQRLALKVLLGTGACRSKGI
jgi:di/tricarboxylate transporter